MELHTTESELDLECQQGLMKMEDNPFKDSMSLYGLPLMPTTCEQNPGPSYCPTSKQCGEMIKHLKELVWNLRLRIHNDRIIAKNAGGGAKQNEALVLQIQELLREIQVLRDYKENSERRFQDYENQKKYLEDCIQAGQQREEILQRRNHELTNRLDVLDHELALANLKQTGDECSIDKSLMTFHIHDDFPCLTPSKELQEQPILTEEVEGQIRELEEQVQQLKDRLDIALEDVTTKSQLIVSLESLLQEKNEQVGKLELQTTQSQEKIVQMTAALKSLGFRHTEEQTLHKNLQVKYQELLEEFGHANSNLEQIKKEIGEMGAKGDRDRQVDDASPDLGIESGMEIPTIENILKAAKENSSEETIKVLKQRNKELASKLKQTKYALDKTLERLERTTLEKEQVEKAVCRQLHRTHGILRQARRTLQTPSEPNIQPKDFSASVAL